jgi:hypothetical protein
MVSLAGQRGDRTVLGGGNDPRVRGIVIRIADAAFAALGTAAPVIERFGLRGFGAHSAAAEYILLDSIEPRLEGRVYNQKLYAPQAAARRALLLSDARGSVYASDEGLLLVA